MADYSLSSKAATDLDRIYEYTILNFGLEQAQKYLLGLHATFGEFAEHPKLARSAGELAEGLRRCETVILAFYIRVTYAIKSSIF